MLFSLCMGKDSWQGGLHAALQSSWKELFTRSKVRRTRLRMTAHSCKLSPCKLPLPRTIAGTGRRHSWLSRVLLSRFCVCKQRGGAEPQQLDHCSRGGKSAALGPVTHTPLSYTTEFRLAHASYPGFGCHVPPFFGRGRGFCCC